MSAIIVRRFLHRILAVVAPLAMACLLAGCGQVDLAPHLRPLSKDTMMLLGKKGMDPQSPIFIRVFKEESELEVWKLRADGTLLPLQDLPDLQLVW